MWESRALLTIISMHAVTVLSAQFFEAIEGIPPTTSGGSSRGVIFIDYNGDSYPDLYVTNGPRGGQDNELYLNDGDGGFSTLVSSRLTSDNSATVGASFGDVNNDGFLDGYLANWYDEGNIYFEGGPDGYKRPFVRGLDSRGHSESAAWGDYNNDGFLDLFIANSSFGGGERNVLVASEAGGQYSQLEGAVTEDFTNSRSVNWVDMNGDGMLDLFVGNEEGPNELYFNVDGVLVRDTVNTLSALSNPTFGSSWDDIDNDGDLDLFLANFGALNRIYANDGQGIFNAKGGGTSQDYSIGSAFGDIDNDGDLDLYVANGFAPEQAPVNNVLLLNDGTGLFTSVDSDVSVSEAGSSYGVAFADYDGDGFLDLAVANTHGAANALFRNLGNQHNWLKVKCNGVLSNFSAIGTVLRVKAAINGEQLWQTRHISTQTGYTSQNSLQAHFGLAGADVIDSLVIEWPTGNRTIMTDLQANQLITVDEPVEQGQFQPRFAVDEITLQDEYEVTFRNTSVFSSEDQPIFQWDFDADGVVDSEEFEPAFRTSQEGTYSVRLTMSVGDVTLQTSNAISLIPSVVLATIPPELAQVYPNPVRNLLYIRSSIQIAEVVLLSLEGKEIMRVAFPEEEIPLIGVSPGLYVLNLYTPDGRFSQQIVVEE